MKSAGASIQVRVYAEDPAKNFQPCSGVLLHVEFDFSGIGFAWRRGSSRGRR